MNIDIDECASILVKHYFENENRFQPITQRTPYFHMGATIVDAILQAGLNYTHVVYPRVEKLLVEFNGYKTTCDFLILCQTIPLTQLINWKNEKKINLIIKLSWLFYENKIETENDLAEWLCDYNNVQVLLNISGIGSKTVDYLKMLSGKQSIPIDRHLFNFLKIAKIAVKSYDEASAIYTTAAKLLNISQYELDKKVWSYMAGI